MNRSNVLAVAVAGLVFGGCAELMTLVPDLIPQNGSLTTEEVIRGLKEALTVGAEKSVSSASIVDGFYGNPQIFIPVPPEAIKVKSTLEQAGLSKLVSDFEKSMNRAAEEATKKSLPIFKNAIVGMTITDAMDILHGPENAATMYLKSRTESELRIEFAPVVRDAIQAVDVTMYWTPVASAYNKMAVLTGGSAVNPNLDEYITQKSLDGLFTLIAQEEKEIRQDPTARVTDILKRVFGSQQKDAASIP